MTTTTIIVIIIILTTATVMTIRQAVRIEETSFWANGRTSQLDEPLNSQPYRLNRRDGIRKTSTPTGISSGRRDDPAGAMKFFIENEEKYRYDTDQCHSEESNARASSQQTNFSMLCCSLIHRWQCRSKSIGFPGGGSSSCTNPFQFH